jgi:hypothetical protein
MKKKYCKICQSEIHERRVKMGYDETCVLHSSAQRYTGVVSSSGKSDYEVSIIRDPEQAKHIVELSNIY